MAKQAEQGSELLRSERRITGGSGTEKTVKRSWRGRGSYCVVTG